MTEQLSVKFAGEARAKDQTGIEPDDRWKHD